jgi:hypothetical protein
MSHIIASLASLTSADVAAEVRYVGRHGGVISGPAAVTIARDWHSPGTVGRTLAAFASGRIVATEDMRDDIAATRREAVAGGQRTDDLDALNDYVNAWTTRGTVCADSDDAPATTCGIGAPHFHPCTLPPHAGDVHEVDVPADGQHYTFTLTEDIERAGIAARRAAGVSDASDDARERVLDHQASQRRQRNA